MRSRSALFDEHGMLVFVLVLVLMGIILGFAQRTVHVAQLQSQYVQTSEDLVQEREFSRTVFEENQRLREANVLLREHVLDLSANISVIENRVRACLDGVPQLQPAVQNTSLLQHRIALSDLSFTPNAVTVNVQSIMPGIVAPSGSMLPLLHEDTIVLEKAPMSPADIYLGDIIIFEYEQSRIIHRVVKMGWDEQGWFVITQGDNNAQEDPLRIRFEQIKGVVVGIIY